MSDPSDHPNQDWIPDDPLIRWGRHIVAIRTIEGVGACTVIKVAGDRALLLVGTQFVGERIQHRSRYLYPTPVEAFEAMQRWIDPSDDPPGPWIWYVAEGPPAIIRTRDPRSTFSIRQEG